MIELVAEAISQLQNEASSYPPGVQIWMRIMAVSFLLSIVFVYAKVGARWILTAFVLNIIGLIAGKILLPEFSRSEIGTYVHLLFWPLMLWMIWKPSSRPSITLNAKSVFDSSYLIWLIWASVIMSISLLLDFKSFLGFLIP